MTAVAPARPAVRYAIVYGGLSGLIIIAVLVAGLALHSRFSGFASEWFGYLVMLVALTFVFVGVKRFRDVDRGGIIGFGRALAVGLGIAAVAGITYAVAWEAYLAATGYTFMDDYVAGILAARRAAGIAGPALAAETARLDAMRAAYADPLYRLPMTFMEIAPVGLLVAIASAALLRNPRFLPARGPARRDNA